MIIPSEQLRSEKGRAGLNILYLPSVKEEGQFFFIEGRFFFIKKKAGHFVNSFLLYDRGKGRGLHSITYRINIHPRAYRSKHYNISIFQFMFTHLPVFNKIK
jgi:hypothetical protein